MRPQSQDDILEELRVILIQQGDDSQILKEARIALGNWYAALCSPPRRERGHLRVLKGGKREGPPESRQPPLMGSS